MSSPALAPLRARIRALERLRPPPEGMLPVHPVVDGALPGGGLPLACLHQIIAADAAGTAFTARLAGTLARQSGRPVLWVTAGDDLFPPGLATFGLDPGRLLVACPGTAADLLWTFEEALKCPDLAAVVGEVVGLDLTAGRRLQLAAETGGVAGFALHPAAAVVANAGSSRWRVASSPGGRWRLVLERLRNGMPGTWEVIP